MATYQEILAQIEELKLKAKEARKQEMAATIAEIKRMMAEYGITLKDLGGRTGKGRAGGTDAKYRDPVSGKTWSGRGRRPAWVVELENRGGNLDSCRI